MGASPTSASTQGRVELSGALGYSRPCPGHLLELFSCSSLLESPWFPGPHHPPQVHQVPRKGSPSTSHILAPMATVVTFDCLCLGAQGPPIAASFLL